MSDSALLNSSGTAAPAASISRARSTATASRLPPPIEPQVRAVATTILAPAARGACPRTAASVTSTPGSRPARSRAAASSQPRSGMAGRPSTCSERGFIGCAPSPGWGGTRPLPPSSTWPCAVCSRACSTAQYTASGVAGDARSTLIPAGPKAAAAWRSASRTENASISGGSPTAFDP